MLGAPKSDGPPKVQITTAGVPNNIAEMVGPTAAREAQVCVAWFCFPLREPRNNMYRSIAGQQLAGQTKIPLDKQDFQVMKISSCQTKISVVQSAKPVSVRPAIPRRQRRVQAPFGLGGGTRGKSRPPGKQLGARAISRPANNTALGQTLLRPGTQYYGCASKRRDAQANVNTPRQQTCARGARDRGRAVATGRP